MDALSAWHCHSHSVGPLMSERGSPPDWLTGLKGSSQEGVGAQAASRRRCISSRLAELLVCSLAASRATGSFDSETLDVGDGDNKTLQ